jgi:hypothetical protein
MKLTIALADLEILLKSAGISRPKKIDTFTLSACAGRIFVEFKGDVAGIEALVLSDGAVVLPAQKFQGLLKTYKGIKFLNLEGGPSGLNIQNFTMPVLSWNPQPNPPANFQIFPV